MANTSRRVGKLASRELRDRKESKRDRSVAGSDLRQRPRKGGKK